MGSLRRLHITQAPKLTIPTSDSTCNFIMNDIILVITPCLQFLKLHYFSLDHEKARKPELVQYSLNFPQYILLCH